MVVCNPTIMLQFRSLAVLLLVAAPVLRPSDKPPTEQAWTILKDGAVDKSAGRRAKVVHSLGLLTTDRQAQGIAEKALTDPDKEVRIESAIALGTMNDRQARPKLHACLNDKEIQVVLACTNALYQFKDPVAYEVYYTLLTGERRSSKGLMQSQLDTLRDRKQVEKLALETGIGFVPFGGMGLQAFRTITHDDVSPVRALAAQRLAADPDPKSGKALSDYVFDKKNKVREAVVEAIAKRGDPALLKTVVALLYDDNESVRFDAAATVIYLSRRRAPSVKPQAAPATPGASK
jgi:HEAT repeat protein